MYFFTFTFNHRSNFVLGDLLQRSVNKNIYGCATAFYLYSSHYQRSSNVCFHENAPDDLDSEKAFLNYKFLDLAKYQKNSNSNYFILKHSHV